MTAKTLTFPRSADEITRALDVVQREALVRFFLTNIAFGIALLFLPFWFVVACSLTNLAMELLTMRLMRGLDPTERPRRYVFSLMSVVMMELSYAVPAGIIWQSSAPYAKAFALGMIMTTLIHLTTVRAIHLAFGFAGFAAVLITVLMSNLVFWVKMDDWWGLAVSTVCAAGGLGYTLTAMLSNNRLHRATADGRTAAQAADMAKGRFLAQMSHELRTPLNAIIGLGQVELDQSKTAGSQERLAVLVASAKGLAEMLDDILDMSAIGAGRLPVRPAPADPSAIIAATVALFRSQAAAAGLTIDLIMPPHLPPTASLDAQRLRQCLSNLLSNALKHSRRGAVRVTVRVQPDLQDKLVIDVADDGPGIPPGDAETVFQPFQRAPSAQPGTGLGLSISRALARQMGGDLVLLSNYADRSGATFRLSIALVPCLPAPAVDMTIPSLLAGKRVLVVDDIATNRLVAASQLARLQMIAVEAAGGAQALTILEQVPVDVVLLDMNMPGLDGMATLQLLRQTAGRNAHIPVIAMTADTTEGHQHTYVAAGIDGYIAKPILPQKLAAELQRVMAETAGSRPKGIDDGIQPIGQRSGAGLQDQG